MFFMKRISLFILAVASLFWGTFASAQTVEVTGTITDAQSGEVVPFASVRVKDTMNGVSANADGKYSISVNANSKAVLVFSFVGYETQEVEVNGRTVVNCRLEVDATTLDDVVVVGYGTAKKVGSLVGSVTTVKSEAIKNAPSSSPLDQLQGQVAGMAVMTTGGVAGDNNVTIKIHGTGSLSSSSQPLYILDGMQSSARSIMALNPNDIKSISILKDASATSIYGSRAANGVVYVITKSGSYNTKATVTVRSQAGISTLADKTLYENMMSGPELKEFWIRSGIKTPEYIKQNFTDKGYDADTKWYNYIQQFNNPQFQNDVTVEGGGQKVAYALGASQFHQRGTAVGNYYDRYTVRSNVQARPKDWLKIGINAALSKDSQQTNANWGDSSDGGAYIYGGLSYLMNPLYPAIDPKTGKEYEIEYPSGFYNPQYYISKRQSLTDRYGLVGGLSVEIQPYKNLFIRSNMGIDGSISDVNKYSKPSAVYNAGNGSKVRGNALQYISTITNTIEYSFNIANEHQISLLAGHEGIANYYDYFAASTEGLTDDRLMELDHGDQSTYDEAESHSESKFLSFFGHGEYSFLDKYILDVTVRNDASSRFGPDVRNAQFWSVGALWKVKKENFLRNVKWLDDLNFKVSYGTQGNAAIGDYQHYGLVGATTSYAGSVSQVISQPENNKLSWEKQGLLTIALNGRVFDTLDFGFEFYNRKTTDMLLSVPYPYTSGFASLMDNIGGLKNTGIDITLGVDILKSRDYFLRFSTTFNYNSEKITELFNGLDRWEISNTSIAYVVGKPISFYMPIYAGVNPENGRNQWYKVGADKDVVTKDPANVTEKFDEASLTQNTGKRLHAPINGGFGLSGGWKGLSFVADFTYVLGKWLVNNDAYFYANPNKNSDYTAIKTVNDFWTPENTDAEYPDWSQGAVMQFDTHLLDNASFLRLKNLQVAYDLPRKWLGNQQILNGLKVTFTGRNLWTLTEYEGIDPEVDSNLTYGVVGNSKQYLFGLEFTF